MRAIRLGLFDFGKIDTAAVEPAANVDPHRVAVDVRVLEDEQLAGPHAGVGGEQHQRPHRRPCKRRGRRRRPRSGPVPRWWAARRLSGHVVARWRPRNGLRSISSASIAALNSVMTTGMREAGTRSAQSMASSRVMESSGRGPKSVRKALQRGPGGVVAGVFALSLVAGQEARGPVGTGQRVSEFSDSSERPGLRDLGRLQRAEGADPLHAAAPPRLMRTR